MLSSSPARSHRFDTAPTPTRAWLRPNKIARSIVVIICALLGLSVSTLALAAAPYLRTDRPIKPEQGRIEVIVDFADDAHGAYPDKPLDEARAREQFMPMPQTLLLVEAFERTYGFKRTGMTTSWVGNSVTAFLTPEQIERLRGDKAVKQVSENTTHQFSAYPAPAWDDTSFGDEWKSWGQQAVFGPGVTKTAGSSSRVVYVIDSGIADHADLNMHPTFPRVNVACGSGGDCDIVGSASDRAQYPVVGCYAHATHVAGIIGARANNAGTVGVYAGVWMRSVSVVKAAAPYTQGASSPIGSSGSPNEGWCAGFNKELPNPTNTPSTATIGFALDWVYNRILFDNAGVGIVNISMNPGGMGYTKNRAGVATAEPNNPKVKRLATPGFVSWGQYYSGAFVVQSAGNRAQNTCRQCNGTGVADDICACNQTWCTWGDSQAFRPTPADDADAADGIMVVGAHHRTGSAVTSSDPFSASDPSAVAPEDDGASNFGACVDVWAPGNAIVSSWGNILNFPVVGAHTVLGPQYSGNVNQNMTSGWLFLSGTSMAAPHVAGAAAYLADAFSLTTPSAIESKLRSYLHSYAVDPTGLPVRTVQIWDLE